MVAMRRFASDIELPASLCGIIYRVDAESRWPPAEHRGTLPTVTRHAAAWRQGRRGLPRRAVGELRPWPGGGLNDEGKLGSGRAWHARPWL
jgi:hypothetical protein